MGRTTEPASRVGRDVERDERDETDETERALVYLFVPFSRDPGSPSARDGPERSFVGVGSQGGRGRRRLWERAERTNVADGRTRTRTVLVLARV